MGEREVRSPWTSQRGVDQRLREGESPGSRTSPSNAPRSDSHLARSPGKGPAMRRDNSIPEPVVGGEHRTPFDYLDRR